MITTRGDVFAHTLSGNSISNAIQWSGPKVAANPHDKGVLVAWAKWAMLYTCGNDPTNGYDPHNSVRGVHLRTSASPWGPWSALPSRYVKNDPGGTTIYFEMSTWNPYQVMLMRAKLGKAP